MKSKQLFIKISLLSTILLSSSMLLSTGINVYADPIQSTRTPTDEELEDEKKNEEKEKDKRYDFKVTQDPTGEGQEVLDKIISLEFDDIKNPVGWITDMQSTVVSAKNKSTGKVSWFFNSPNLQNSTMNDLTSQLSASGYGNIIGQDVSEDKRFFEGVKRDKARTASQLFGYNIPTPTYVGEKPLTTINVGGVIIPSSTVGKITKSIKSIFTGDIVKYKDYQNNMGSLTYLAPRDYGTSSTTFEQFIQDNWVKINTKGHPNYLEDGQVINAEANGEDNGKATGKIPGSNEVYVVKNILRDGSFDGIDSTTKEGAKQIYNILEDKTGDQFQNVCRGIVEQSQITSNLEMERIMPYDTSTMTAGDRKMFKGVEDPRVKAQEPLLMSWAPFVKNILNSFALKVSGWLAKLTVAFDKIGSFSFIEGVGIKPTMFWDNFIIQILIWLMSGSMMTRIAFVGFRMLRSRMGLGRKIVGFVAQTFFIMITLAIATKPAENYERFKNISTTIFTVTDTITLQQNDMIKPLYGNTTLKDSALQRETTLWLPYFNMWTEYQTNYSITDSEQKIRRNGMPEEKRVSNVTLDGGRIELPQWSAILASNLTNPGSTTSNEVYRMVDHFMAPRIKFDNAADNPQILDVKQNENYKRPIQSGADWPILVTQLGMFFTIFFKNLVFFELVLNLSMMIYELVIVINSKKGIAGIFKRIGANVIVIMAFNLAITFCINMSMTVSGMILFLLSCVYIGLLFKAIGILAKSNSVFTPRAFKSMVRLANKTVDLFKDNDNTRENTQRDIDALYNNMYSQNVGGEGKYREDIRKKYRFDD